VKETPELTFRPVDLQNYFAVMKLEMVPGQERFIDSNAWPLAEAAYVEGFTPEAVYLGETLIGLVSWGPYYPGYAYDKAPQEGSTIIDHVMLARPYQGRGLGRRIVTSLIARLSQRHGARRLVLMLHPDNEVASNLYKTLGFTEFSTTHEGDLLMELPISGSP
jgi:diamine N-acetyltransferase